MHNPQSQHIDFNSDAMIGVYTIKGNSPSVTNFTTSEMDLSMKKPRYVLDEKARIIMESINTHITIAELCSRHNISSMAFTRWSESFVKLGKVTLYGKTRDNAVKTLTKEN